MRIIRRAGHPAANEQTETQHGALGQPYGMAMSERLAPRPCRAAYSPSAPVSGCIAPGNRSKGVCKALCTCLWPCIRPRSHHDLSSHSFLHDASNAAGEASLQVLERDGVWG